MISSQTLAIVLWIYFSGHTSFLQLSSFVILLDCFIVLPPSLNHARFACQAITMAIGQAVRSLDACLSAPPPFSPHALLPYPSPLFGLLSARSYSLRPSRLLPEESRIYTFGSGPAMWEKLREGRSYFSPIRSWNLKTLGCHGFAIREVECELLLPSSALQSNQLTGSDITFARTVSKEATCPARTKFFTSIVHKPLPPCRNPEFGICQMVHGPKVECIPIM